MSLDPKGEDAKDADWRSMDASDAAAGMNDTFKKDADASSKKQYRVATGCLSYKRVDNTMFGSIIVNNCGYKVLFTFCTISPMQSGMFSCARHQFGADSLDPNRSTAIFGIGIPKADDPFKVAFGGCEYPGFTHITRMTGEKISMVCR